MRRILWVAVFAISVQIGFSQKTDSLTNQYSNSADQLLVSDSRLTLGGYAQIDYNQPFDGETMNNGTLDVHRLVLLVGYNFSDRVSFISEIEFEHVSEVYVEQAFLNYRINPFINFRGGLMLVPMGIVNEYHEPTAYNGVERPLVDKYIAPTTWREIGAGFTGNIPVASLKYQAYVMNGFNGYDGDARLNGKNGLRKGRQKGIKSYISSPNISTKVEYYGIRGLNLGLSGYFGKTQSTLYDGISKDDNGALASADSSVVGVSMVGIDARYTRSGIQLRGQLYFTSLSNSDQYNSFTATEDGLNDLGESMIGYYIEGAYNVFQAADQIKSELTPFVRYEKYNTHHSVDASIEKNLTYDNTVITTGIGWKMTQGSVIKADLQFFKSEEEDKYDTQFNAGIGIMF